MDFLGWQDKENKKNGGSGGQQQQQQPLPNQQHHTDLVERIALERGDINEAIINAAVKMKETSSASSKDEDSSLQEDQSKDSDTKNDEDDEGEDDDIPLEKEKKPLSVVQQLASGVDVAPSEEGKYPTKKASPPPPPKSINIPDCHPEIHKTAIERHRQSQMSPYVHQLLTRG